MSLRKVSDLPPITDEQLESNEFNNALIEMSYPVYSGEAIMSYTSEYIRNSLYFDYISKQITGFNNPIYFTDGLYMSGNMSCNAGLPYNNYHAYFNFGNGIEFHSNELSIYDNDGQIIATFGYPYSTIYSNLSAIGNNIINVETPTYTENVDMKRVVNKEYVNTKISSELNKIDLGMFASCDYAIVTALPSDVNLKPNTFYFVLESEE